MEKELSCSQSRKEIVLHEAYSGWIFGVRFEVRQTSISEAVWNSLSVNYLLSHTCDHLTEVDF